MPGVVGEEDNVGDENRGAGEMVTGDHQEGFVLASGSQDEAVFPERRE